MRAPMVLFVFSGASWLQQSNHLKGEGFNADD
jgi:hypothetical protein